MIRWFLNIKDKMMYIWYVFREKELLGYVHAISLYQAKVLAYTDFGNDIILKKSKGYHD